MRYLTSIKRLNCRPSRPARPVLSRPSRVCTVNMERYFMYVLRDQYVRRNTAGFTKKAYIVQPLIPT